jgi:hypothetical protein
MGRNTLSLLRCCYRRVKTNWRRPIGSLREQPLPVKTDPVVVHTARVTVIEILAFEAISEPTRLTRACDLSIVVTIITDDANSRYYRDPEP